MQEICIKKKKKKNREDDSKIKTQVISMMKLPVWSIKTDATIATISLFS